MGTIKEAILEAVPNEDGRVITLHERFYRGKEVGDVSINWVDATPPASQQRNAEDLGLVIPIDHELLDKECCIESLTELLSSRMVKYYVVSAYVMTQHTDPRVDKKVPILHWTSGTAGSIVDLMKLFQKLGAK